MNLKPHWHCTGGSWGRRLASASYDVSPFEEVSELITLLSSLSLSLSSPSSPSPSKQPFPSALSSSSLVLLGHVGIARPALIVSLSLCHPSWGATAAAGREWRLTFSSAVPNTVPCMGPPTLRWDWDRLAKVQSQKLISTDRYCLISDDYFVLMCCPLLPT